MNPQEKDTLSQELDRRKLQKLIADGILTEDEINDAVEAFKRGYIAGQIDSLKEPKQ